LGFERRSKKSTKFRSRTHVGGGKTRGSKGNAPPWEKEKISRDGLRRGEKDKEEPLWES